MKPQYPEAGDGSPNTKEVVSWGDRPGWYGRVP